jgi:hypothetical protein
MFEGTYLVLNTESFSSNISYKSFKTYNLAKQNSYCDHRNFGSVNQTLEHWGIWLEDEGYIRKDKTKFNRLHW